MANPDTRDLLIEIGTEELPPKALSTLAAAFEQGIRAGLEKAGLASGAIQRFATPRRRASALVERLNKRCLCAGVPPSSLTSCTRAICSCNMVR